MHTLFAMMKSVHAKNKSEFVRKIKKRTFAGEEELFFIET